MTNKPPTESEEATMEKVKNIQGQWHTIGSTTCGPGTGFLVYALRDNFPDIAALMEKLWEENQKLRKNNEELEKALKELPEQLRSQLDGHKGQAYRIAVQLTEKALLAPPPSNQ